MKYDNIIYQLTFKDKKDTSMNGKNDICQKDKQNYLGQGTWWLDMNI